MGETLDRDAIVRAIAVLGADAMVQVVADLVEMQVPELLFQLDLLVDAGLVVRGVPLALTASGTRCADLGRTPPGQRIRERLAAAGVLHEAGFAARAVATQLLQAGPAGLPWAAGVLRAAAAEARQVSDLGYAEDCLWQALAERPDQQQRAAMVVELAAVADARGRRDVTEMLMGELRRTSAPEAVLLLVEELRRRLIADGRSAELPRLHDLALDVLAGGSCTAAARLELRSGAIGVQAMTGLKALDATVHRIAEHAEDQPELSTALRAVRASRAVLFGRDADQTLPEAQAVLAAVDPVSEFEECWHALFAMSTIADPAETATATRLVRDRVSSHADSWDLAELDRLLAFALRRKGDLPGSIALLERVLARPEVTRNRLVTAGLVAGLVDAIVATGDGRDVLSLLAAHDLLDGKADLEPLPLILYARGVAYLSVDQAESAARAFLECGSLLTGLRLENPELIPWRSGAVRVLLRLDRRAEAGQIAKENLAQAEVFGTRGAVGSARYVLALTRPAADRRELLAAACDDLLAAGQVLDEAIARYELAKTLRLEGDDDGASRQFLRAMELADQCEARLLAERARSLAGPAARPGRRRGLTTQEWKVARLAADGLSNPEIAKELFLVRRTVEFHLSGVYRKLDVSGRRELIGLLRDVR